MSGDDKVVGRQFYLTEEQLRLLDEWADEEDRSRTSMMRKLVDDEKERRVKKEAA